MLYMYSKANPCSYTRASTYTQAVAAETFKRRNTHINTATCMHHQCKGKIMKNQHF